MTLTEIKQILAANPLPEVLAKLKMDKRTGVQKLLAAYAKKQQQLQAEKLRLIKLYSYESSLYQSGHKLIAGVDEAGRGPLAGPLVVAAVILPEHCFLPGLNDSKKLAAKKREELFGMIQERALAVHVKFVPEAEIDSLNIYQATYAGMRAALLALEPKPEAALIDAMPLNDLPFSTISLVNGDSLSASIAAASIIAKVSRDKLMLELDQKYPHYGFAKHKGYGTPEHLAALEKYGPAPCHRKSFEPIKSLLLR